MDKKIQRSSEEYESGFNGQKVSPEIIWTCDNDGDHFQFCGDLHAYSKEFLAEFSRNVINAIVGEKIKFMANQAASAIVAHDSRLAMPEILNILAFSENNENDSLLSWESVYHCNSLEQLKKDYPQGLPFDVIVILPQENNLSEGVLKFLNYVSRKLDVSKIFIVEDSIDKLHDALKNFLEDIGVTSFEEWFSENAMTREKFTERIPHLSRIELDYKESFDCFHYAENNTRKEVFPPEIKKIFYNMIKDVSYQPFLNKNTQNLNTTADDLKDLRNCLESTVLNVLHENSCFSISYPFQPSTPIKPGIDTFHSLYNTHNGWNVTNVFYRMETMRHDYSEYIKQQNNLQNQQNDPNSTRSFARWNAYLTEPLYAQERIRTIIFPERLPLILRLIYNSQCTVLHKNDKFSNQDISLPELRTVAYACAELFAWLAREIFAKQTDKYVYIP